MPWTKACVPVVLVACLGACKSEARKLREVRECSAITMDAKGAAQCLVLQYRWKQSAALAAATAYQQEQDSLAQVHANSAWRADAAKHVQEVRTCAADPSGEVSRCLILYGWADARAKATADSLWRVDAPRRREQIRSCSNRRGVGVGACLQLYYKWSPERALALDDSIRRAQMRR